MIELRIIESDTPPSKSTKVIKAEEVPVPEPEEILTGLDCLAGSSADYWEPEKYDSEEPRVRMSSDPTLIVLPAEEFSRELKEQVVKWDLKEVTLTQEQLRELIELLNRYPEVFSEHEFDLGYFTAWEHSVDTGDHPPIKAKARPLSQAKLKALREITTGLEKHKQIVPSVSTWASGIVMVPKKTPGAWRMCMDFRPLNAIATCCQFPLPRISDILQSLRGAKYFTAIDLTKGFHQIPLAKDSQCKVAFVTPIGQWEWTTTPMGLHSAPAAFQAAMQLTLSGLEHNTLVYVDDIIVFTKDFAEHLEALELVFCRLKKYNLKACPPKCEFARTQLAYLGHIVNAHGVHTDPRKTSAVRDMPEPICTLDVECFLGKTGYYQRFIADYAQLAHPLMKLKKKGVIFHFGEVERAAFEILKDRLCSAPLLKYPDYERPFCIATDASGYALGAVLFQKYGEDEMPLAYASRKLRDVELRYSATEREALAVWWACDHFIDYIDEVEVTIYSDHKALLALPTKEMSNRRLQLIAHKLSEFRYRIEYRPGKDNANADALSRYPTAPCKGHRSKETQTNESVGNGFDKEDPIGDRLPKFKKVPLPAKGTEKEDRPDPQIPITLQSVNAMENLLAQQPVGYVADLFSRLAALQAEVLVFKTLKVYVDTGILTPTTPPLRLELIRVLDSCRCREGSDVLRRLLNGKSVICAPPQIWQPVFADAHEALGAGHLGVDKTLRRIQERFWWPGMSMTVREKIRDCPLCQAHKSRPRPPRERLGDRPPPETPWERIHMDVWTAGGESEDGNKHVLGLVDAFSKYLILIPVEDHKSATVAQCLMEHVLLPYGMPQEIASDNASDFTSDFRKEMYAGFGITRKVSTPFRPQSNGQIERMFSTMRSILAALASKAPSNWDHYLNLTAHCYNTSFHATIKDTPFHIMYGRDPNPLPEHHMEPEYEDNRERVRRWKTARAAAYQGLCDGQTRSKAYYDTVMARPQGEIEVGDCVLRVTTTMPVGAIRKLYPRFVGPYRVVKVVGSVLWISPLHAPPRVKLVLRIHKDRVRTCQDDYPNIHTWRELAHQFDPGTVSEPLDEEETEADNARNCPPTRLRRVPLTTREPGTQDGLDSEESDDANDVAHPPSNLDSAPAEVTSSSDSEED